MLNVIGCSLQEIIEFKGNHLKETELWAVIEAFYKQQNSLKICSDLISNKNIITPNCLTLLPNGKLSIKHTNVDLLRNKFCSVLNTCDSTDCESKHTNQSFGLTLLWCAEYNLDKNTPLNLSNNLLKVITEICETQQETISFIESYLFSDDKLKCSKTLINMYEEIMGDYFNSSLQNYPNNYLSSKKPKTNYYSSVIEAGLLGDSTSFPSSTSLETNTSKRKEPSMMFLNDTSSLEQSYENSKLLPSTKRPTKKSLFEECKCFKSLLDATEYIANNASIDIVFMGIITFRISYDKSVPTTVRKILSKTLTLLKFMEDSTHFALSYVVDAEYVFLEKEATLQKVLPLDIQKLHLRIMFFPIDVDNIGESLLRAMYMQTRSDIADGSIGCNHNDSLELCSLALQCDFGDYNTEYGLNYYAIEEYIFDTHHLGVAYVRSQVCVLHRQLAGIDAVQSMRMYLLRCQQVEEYGAHTYKVYKNKKAYDEGVSKLLIGPKGLVCNDMKRQKSKNNKKIVLWTSLKHLILKGRKLKLLQKSEENLKLYLKNSVKAKYIHQLVIESYNFYSSAKPCSKFSTLALFDGITKLSSPMNAIYPAESSSETNVTHNENSETSANVGNETEITNTKNNDEASKEVNSIENNFTTYKKNLYDRKVQEKNLLPTLANSSDDISIYTEAEC